MRIETFRWLAGVIAAHPEGKIVGRTRLQKTIRLLQRVGLPTDYSYKLFFYGPYSEGGLGISYDTWIRCYKLFFYGPYSEGVQAGVGVLESCALATEEERAGQDGTSYYVIRAAPDAQLPAIKPFQKQIDMLSGEPDPVIQELAATYDAFRELGSDHEEALEQLRRKKGAKCGGGRETKALKLLREMGLPVT